MDDFYFFLFFANVTIQVENQTTAAATHIQKKIIQNDSIMFRNETTQSRTMKKEAQDVLRVIKLAKK